MNAQGSKSADVRYVAAEKAQRLILASVAIGVVGIVLAFASSFLANHGFRHFLYAYVLNFCYFLSLSLGALFFVLLHHVTRAGWSVVVRRMAEVMASAIPFWALLFLPILLLVLMGNGSLYSWNDANVVQHDELIQKKAAYLNAPFFAARAIGYFALWTAIAWYYRRKSLLQDETADKSLTLRMQKWSGPGLLVYAGTVSFASFDWLMSLDPHWFSTIYGVYFFSGCAIGVFAALVLAAVVLQQRGFLLDSITTEHYHDLGKFLFGFVFFWGYIAFSQYLLIWYANIPEETTWFLVRQSGDWLWVSMLLLFGHLLVPFCGLMSRSVKRNKFALAGWSGFLLAMHWIDLYWLVMPQLSEAGPAFGIVDVFCFVGFGGIYLAVTLQIATGRALVPVQDPWLSESLAFKNV